MVDKTPDAWEVHTCLALVLRGRSWIAECVRLEGEGVEDFGFPCNEARWQHPVVSGPLDVEPGAARSSPAASATSSRSPASAPSGAKASDARQHGSSPNVGSCDI